MEVRVDFQEPCEECIIQCICSATCERYFEFHTLATFESFNRMFFKDQQDEFLSYEGISIENREKKKASK